MRVSDLNLIDHAWKTHGISPQYFPSKQHLLIHQKIIPRVAGSMWKNSNMGWRTGTSRDEIVNFPQWSWACRKRKGTNFTPMTLLTLVPPNCMHPATLQMVFLGGLDSTSGMEMNVKKGHVLCMDGRIKAQLILYLCLDKMRIPL